MLYASTRANLTKSLGSAHFTDNLFATDKSDVTAEAYKKHKAHLNAPKPMSEREKEMAAVKAAERAVGGSQYEGSRARRNPLGSQAIGLQWDESAENALKELADAEEFRTVILVRPYPHARICGVLTTLSVNRSARGPDSALSYP